MLLTLPLIGESQDRPLKWKDDYKPMSGKFEESFSWVSTRNPAKAYHWALTFTPDSGSCDYVFSSDRKRDTIVLNTSKDWAKYATSSDYIKIGNQLYIKYPYDFKAYQLGPMHEAEYYTSVKYFYKRRLMYSEKLKGVGYEEMTGNIPFKEFISDSIVISSPIKSIK